jgi:pSer/pThr/pTyr-binding forkhead associated (FHA) protein
MPVLRLNDQDYALKPGATRLGGEGADVDLRVSPESAPGVHAIIEVAPRTPALIRRAGNGVVKVNGVMLGAEPTPLIHGDRVEIAGRELFFVDDAKGGTTQYVNREEVASILKNRPGAAASAPGATARATQSTGGRLISLVDGKEYEIPASGITIGRDASCGVVVAQSEVSRKHAEIAPTDTGYVVHDYSTNGVYVNEARVQKSRLLARADVLRIGDEEFRFYADVRAAAPAPANASAPVRVAPAPTPPPAASAPAASPPPPAPTARPAEAADVPQAVSTAPMAAVPAMKEVATAPAIPAVSDDVASAPAAHRPVLATLEVINEGVNRGKRYEIHVPLAHIGRGAHNDVVIDDESVSDTHAKLQRRQDGWYLVDVGSTNGTYVGGARLLSERRLDGTPDVRTGGVKMVFRAAEQPAAGTKGTRAIASTPIDRSVLARPTRPAMPATEVPDEEVPQSSSRVWLWFFILAAALAGAIYLLKTR